MIFETFVLELLSNIFENLIENAIIYTAKKTSAKIVISWTQENDKVLIEIADESPGFPKDVVANLFEPFVRGDEREVSGSGLGLSIAKKSVVLIGGEICLKESISIGSKLVVMLPLFKNN